MESHEEKLSQTDWKRTNQDYSQYFAGPMPYSFDVDALRVHRRHWLTIAKIRNWQCRILGGLADGGPGPGEGAGWQGQGTG
jgi:hypothetical protein